VIAISLLVGNVSTVAAQDFRKGVEAYDAGDYQTALTEWRPLAEQGNAEAQYRLGSMYAFGEGVPQDNDKSSDWYRDSAYGGFAAAQTLWGNVLYIRGMYDEALRLRRLAIQQGETGPHYSMALHYEYGKGVLQDYKMAYMWFNIAEATNWSGQPLPAMGRNAMALKLTNADISKAQEMARECMSSNYQNCGN
jgi:TPR repeat protein